MNIIELVRLVLKHIRLLIIIPLLLAILVIVLTMNPSFEYSSQSILYTGLASGSSIEMDKKFNYQAANTAFDNLINIIQSRETQEEVAVRLLAQHLMLEEQNDKYISKAFYDELKKKIPEDLYNYVVTEDIEAYETIDLENISTIFPAELDPIKYEKTVQNLTNLMRSSNDNFVYELLNYDDDKHYSLKAISSVKAVRISNSDLIKLTYTVNDPGICQQTLDIYNKVCIKNYKFIKENRSDAVVKYFEAQLDEASKKLKSAEDKLLEFRKSSKIINYYEQSKAVAVVKEDMVVDYNKKKAELAGLEAATKRLESKLSVQEIIQQKSNYVLEKKKELGGLNYEIAMLEAKIDVNGSDTYVSNLNNLKNEANSLSKDIKKSVDELYSYQNSIDGLPVTQILPDWMRNVADADNLRTKIKLIEQQNKDFLEQYDTYAPAGANMKKIEREISVSEQGYLEILHGLNLAKLKLQDNSMSANLKTIDPPFYPLYPIPSKRKILIIAAAFIGCVFTLGILLVMEYFDNTIKNSHKAHKVIGIPSFGMIPKILQNPLTTNMYFVQTRLIEIITQNILQFLTNNDSAKTILFFSTQEKEGKSVLSGNIAKALKENGKRVLVLNYAGEDLQKEGQRKFSIINKIFGYQDPRIDMNSEFLAHATKYLDDDEYHTYNIDKQFFKAKNYTDILKLNTINLDYTPDFVIIEFPSLIYNHHPTNLFKTSDLDILITRANRVWSKADQAALGRLKPFSENKMNFIVNGEELKEIESILGDLPKKRTGLRKRMKSAFRFQFFTKSQI